MSWNDVNFKEKFLKDPIGAMHAAYGYVCPFDVKFEAKASGPDNEHYYDALHTGGWVGTNNTVELCLPPAPAREQRAEALAAYNHDCIFFLREKSSEGRGK
jgi:ribosomally synthesized peptide (two-chain TOMM family)